MWIFVIILKAFIATASDAWIEQQNRLFIEDRIQYWGTGSDTVEEMALFKAKGMAIKSIGEECGGYFSKDIIIRRQKIVQLSGGYRAFVHADIPYVSCNYSKTPMAKNNPNLENPSIILSQKLYNSLIEDQFKQKDQKESHNIRKKILLFIDQNEKKIGELDARIKTLELRPAQINQTIIQQNIQMTASESSFQECIEEARELLNEANRLAYKNCSGGCGFKGGTKAGRLYNKYQSKIAKCNRITR